MNLLIADSGATKTDWRFIDGNRAILAFRSEGYNPWLVEAEQMEESMRREVLVQLGNQLPEQICFYGAGCGTPEKKEIVASVLSKLFGNAAIEVHTDLLGAARSLCGPEHGIAAILGTGSNSCSFDGVNIVENRPSLGYVLGDEGSGAGLGKELLRKFLYDDLDLKLKENFVKRFNLSRAEILDHIYKQPLPNRYLASFAKFIFQNIEHPQCSGIVIESFRAFFTHHILRYPGAKELPLHVTGSVGFYFSNLLRRVAEEQGVRLGRVTETPIAGLLNYHIGE
ncbi:MAG: N-acetylglucosamine kinase [Bacteroidota bacterium]|nr:N-acetylglucosamine kinase [Bacteroidota bacterium]